MNLLLRLFSIYSLLVFLRGAKSAAITPVPLYETTLGTATLLSFVVEYNQKSKRRKSMREIWEQLARLKISTDKIEEIRSKDGVFVYRIFSEKNTYVLKYFEKVEHRREIENYRLLKSLNIPTINVIGSTGSGLLLEDISQSETHILGELADLSDTETARLIAKWYKALHEKGYEHLKIRDVDLYAELDNLTMQNLEPIKTKTLTTGAPVWEKLEKNLDIIVCKANSFPKTLTYNDFYYTNLIVAKNKTSAMMFDYNLLGKGYAYSDIRNVCYSLGDAAKAAFLDEYGTFDPLEKITDDVVSVLVTLIFACRHKKIPPWANGSLKKLHDGTLSEKIDVLLKTAAKGVKGI